MFKFFRMGLNNKKVNFSKDFPLPLSRPQSPIPIPIPVPIPIGDGDGDGDGDREGKGMEGNLSRTKGISVTFEG